MTTLIILLLMLAFFLLYNTSNRIRQVSVCKLGNWAQAHTRTAKYTAGAIIGIALVLSIMHFGMTSGFFAFGAGLMFVASAVVLLMPLRLVRPLSVLVICTIIMSAEIIFS